MYRHYSKTLALSFFNAVTHFVDMLRCPVPTVDPFYSCFILLGRRHLPRKQCSWLHEVARCPEQHWSCSRRRRAALSFVAPPLAVAKEKKRAAYDIQKNPTLWDIRIKLNYIHWISGHRSHREDPARKFGTHYRDE